jgi:mannose/cellobiose epimerase-like protein (N-acyl-D-glucosamine 2-epimerase family)
MQERMGDEQLAVTDAAADVVARLKRRVIEHCLPLWSGEGWDAAAGGFVDRLAPDGLADRQAPRRVFVQARQIYCFAKAAQMGWYADGRAIALKGLEHLLAKAKSPDGRPGYVHKLTPDGAALDPRRDTYDHAFVLLALATVYALDRRARCAARVPGHAIALAEWRLSGRPAAVAAPAAESAYAPVRSHDRGVRCDP